MTAKTGEQKEIKTKRPQRIFTASEKCRAVLALWTERRNAAAVCRELSIKWVQLNIWQNHALEGMLKALDTGRSPERAMLGDRLERLLDRKTEPRPSMLAKRLDMIVKKKEIQQEKTPG